MSDEVLVSESELLAGQLEPRAVAPAEVAAEVAASGRRVVVLDDDPTGTQTVADVPVLTSWEPDDLRWALRQPAPAFFVLTNTRSLQPEDAAARNREVVDRLIDASHAEQVPFVVISRSDSTLRGHFPLETDVIADELASRGATEVDAVVIVPAFIDSGRLTVDSVHWARSGGGLIPVGHSEFARDATFGFSASDLREYVEEKSRGRWRSEDVARVTLRDLREGGADAVAAILGDLRDRHPVVVDAACDDDLRLLALAALRAEAAGKVLLYRVGPSFVRARIGMPARPPLTAEEIGRIGTSRQQDAAARDRHGLVAVGSHVALTTRQLDGLLRLDGVEAIELDVDAVVGAGGSRAAATIAAAVDGAVERLASADVVVNTSRSLRTGADAEESLRIAGLVSDALVEVVRSIVARRPPAWIVAKGGITSSDLASRALGLRRAQVRGSMLPGITSLWEPVDGPAVGIPFVVFPGNVGGDDALADVVELLRAGR